MPENILLEFDKAGAELVYQKSIPEPNSGCWLWNSYGYPNGYGKACIYGTYIYAHRLSYLVHKGAIPEDQEIHHTCEVKCCVNPYHLVAMRHADHQWLHGSDRMKTHCKHGHEFTEANTILHYRARNGTTERICRSCRDRRNGER